jgi:hypothetical protein
MKYYEITDGVISHGIKLWNNSILLGSGAAGRELPLPNKDMTIINNRLIESPDNPEAITVLIRNHNEGNFAVRGKFHVLHDAPCSGADKLGICDPIERLVAMRPGEEIEIIRSDVTKSCLALRNINGQLLEVNPITVTCPNSDCGAKNLASNGRTIVSPWRCRQCGTILAIEEEIDE